MKELPPAGAGASGLAGTDGQAMQGSEGLQQLSDAQLNSGLTTAIALYCG